MAWLRSSGLERATGHRRTVFRRCPAGLRVRRGDQCCGYRPHLVLLHALSVSLAVGVRWKFAGLAGLASLATLVLLALTLRSLRQDELVRASEPRHDRRRRSGRGRPDARAALALVGDALAATHNPRALVPVILDVVTEATGARGARILRDGEELGWIGEPGGGTATSYGSIYRPRMKLTRTELVLYPPPEGIRGRDEAARRVARGPSRDRARERAPARSGPAPGDHRRPDGARQPAALPGGARHGGGAGGRSSRPVSPSSWSTSTTSRASTTASGTTREIACSRPSAVCSQEHIRDVDLAARLGGEEFALLLPEIERPGCRSGRRAVVSFAVGAARSPRWKGTRSARRPASAWPSTGTGDTGEDLLRLADDALYRAKGEGKNRVCVARQGRAA